MAVAFLQSTDLGSGTTTVTSTTNNITAGSNLVGFVFVEQSTLFTNGDPTSVTWGGVSMTKIASTTETPVRSGAYSLWALINPTTGASTNITWNFASNYNSHATMMTVSGASQTTPVTSYVVGSASSSSTNGQTISLTPSEANSLLVGFMLDLASTRTVNANTTQAVNGNWNTYYSTSTVSSSTAIGYSSFNTASMAASLAAAVPPPSLNNSNFFNFF